MPQKKKIPTIELDANPEEDKVVYKVSIVTNPAIESDFLFFSNEDTRETFERFNTANDEKMELFGAAMIPDIPIYRKDNIRGEWYARFTKAAVRKNAMEFLKRGYQFNMNVEHTNRDADSFIFKSAIVGEMGQTSPEGLNLPDGTWVVGVKVNDVNLWNEIKAGKRRGFSIEGVFEMEELDLSEVIKEEEDSIELDEATKKTLLQFNTLMKIYNK